MCTCHQCLGIVACCFRCQILAVKSTTYFLGEVPKLHSLIESMTSQQLAHFSRVLALLVFEPEYRQLTENAHVLRYGRGTGGAGQFRAV